MGLSIFDGPKMVGTLDGEEATYYLMASGEFSNSNMTLPDPKEKGLYVVLNVKQSRKPESKVEMIGGRPKITLKVKVEADYLSIQSHESYEDDEGREIFEKASEDFIRQGLLRMLQKTAAANSDICGFGMKLKQKSLTWNEWENVKWLTKYKDATFDVDVDLKVRRPGLLIRSAPFYTSGGREKTK